MRKFIYGSLLLFALLLVLAAILFGKEIMPPTRLPPAEPSKRAQPQRLRDDVIALSEPRIARNYLNLAALENAAVLIDSTWKQLGLQVHEQHFEAANNDYRNLIVSFGPEAAPRYIVGAHYDVCDDTPGADDNASGVAALLELSRLLVANQFAPKDFRLDLVAYTLEEPPFFTTEYMGSAIHAQSLREEGVSVLGMISLEMVGFFSDEAGSQLFPYSFMQYFYPTTGNFLLVASNVQSYGLARTIKNVYRSIDQLPTHSISAPDWVRGIDFSDHRNYAARDYPAVMLTDTAFFRNENYHRVTDRASTLDYERMALVVDGLYRFLLKSH